MQRSIADLVVVRGMRCKEEEERRPVAIVSASLVSNEAVSLHCVAIICLEQDDGRKESC